MIVMKCPNCNKEMDAGYIQCRDGIYWSEKKRIVAALPPIKGKYIDLRVVHDGNYESYAMAYNCSICKKIIIDYSQQ